MKSKIVEKVAAKKGQVLPTRASEEAFWFKTNNHKTIHEHSYQYDVFFRW